MKARTLQSESRAFIRNTVSAYGICGCIWSVALKYFLA
jgi:hypothetical protein